MLQLLFLFFVIAVVAVVVVAAVGVVAVVVVAAVFSLIAVVAVAGCVAAGCKQATLCRSIVNSNKMLFKQLVMLVAVYVAVAVADIFAKL